jgi:hypothetical protein
LQIADVISNPDHLGKQLHNVELGSWPLSRTQGRIPSSRLAKYAKIEEQANQAGEEIRLLSRFISAQRTAFVKLLKKYAKWTGRDSLGARFNTEVVQSPDSFVHTDLTAHLEHWTMLLDGISVAMGQGHLSAASSPAILPMVPKQSSSDVSKRINEAMRSNSDVHFDTVFTYCPIGNDGARAVYWVHPEQLVELQVLLLQYTRSAFSRPSTSSSTSNNTAIVRRSSAGRPETAAEKPADHGVIVVDDGERFAQKQNSIPISDAEEAYSRPHIQPAATVMWTINSEAVLCITDNFKQSTENGFTTATTFKKKHLGTLLDVEKPYDVHSSGSNTPVSAQPLSSHENVEESRTWLKNHSNAAPLVAFLSRRTRFASLPTTRDHGIWCTLDADVSLKTTKIDDLEGKEWPQRLSKDGVRFPYAVLEVRQEGNNEVDLIKILDESYLVSLASVSGEYSFQLVLD